MRNYRRANNGVARTETWYALDDQDNVVEISVERKFNSAVTVSAVIDGQIKRYYPSIYLDSGDIVDTFADNYGLSRPSPKPLTASRRANHRVARDWGDRIDELLWHFDALYGEVGDDSIRDFLWGNDSFGLQYEFDAFMKSAPPSVRKRAMSRVKTMFKFLKTSHRANRSPKRKLVNEDSQVIVDYLLERHDEWDLNQYIQDSRNDNYGVGRDLAQLSVDNPNSDFYTLLLKTLGKSSHRANRRVAYYDDYLESGGAFNYENPNYEYYTDREIEEGLRPREFDGWSNRETQLAIGATGDIDVYLSVDNLAWNGTPNDIAQYYQNNIDHSGYDLNLVNWEEIWEAMRDQ